MIVGPEARGFIVGCPVALIRSWSRPQSLTQTSREDSQLTMKKSMV